MRSGQKGQVVLRVCTRLSAFLLFSVAGTRLALAQPQPQPPMDAPPGLGLQNMTPPPPGEGGQHGGVTGGGTAAAGNAEAELIAGKFKDPMKSGAKKQPLDIKVDSNQLVDLAVKDEDLSNVLEMLSLQSQKNIIASKDVNAKVNANFFGVTFYQALDAILHSNGFGYIEKDNFIYVYTAEQIKAIIDASKVRVSKVINLNYINPIDAAEFVKAALSEGGQIKTPGKTGAFPTSKDTPQGQEDYAGRSMFVVTDFEENIAAIEELVKRLDERPVQVEIQATIVQAELTENNAFGVDFSLLTNLDFSSLTGVGGPGKAADALNVNNSSKLSTPSSSDVPLVGDGSYGGAAVSNPGNFAGPGTLKLGFIKNDVAVFLRVLDQVTDTTVLSNPKLLVLNRMASRVLVGRRVGYLNTTSTDTATTQTVEFLDTGTQLHVRPFVADNGEIRLELKPQVSEAIVRDVRNSAGNVVTVPDEITNELTTNVIVRDGQTVVLGGLFRDKTQTTRRQVPILGDIPILGEAFRGTENDIERTEIIFLVTPRIVNDQAMAAAGLRGLEKVEQLRAGARNSLLQFSRDRQSSQLLVEAQHLADAGETQKALFKVQQSLALNPVQTDALALKERLTGQKTYWPSRSMLDDILRKEQGLPKADAQTAPETATTSAEQATSPVETSTPVAVGEETTTVEPTTTTPATTTTTPETTPTPETTTESTPGTTTETTPATTPETTPGTAPEMTPETPTTPTTPETPETPGAEPQANAGGLPTFTVEQQAQLRTALAALYRYLTGFGAVDNSNTTPVAGVVEQDAPSK